MPVSLHQCPVCKKADPCTHGVAHCPRCGCDLTKSTAVHTAAHSLITVAAASLRAGHYQDALSHAEDAWALHHLPSIPPLACLAALHSRQLSVLARWRARL